MSNERNTSKRLSNSRFHLVALLGFLAAIAGCGGQLENQAALQTSAETPNNPDERDVSTVSQEQDVQGTSGDELAKQSRLPNTIYVKTVDGGLTLENLLSFEIKQEDNPQSGGGPGSWVVHGPLVERLSHRPGGKHSSHTYIVYSTRSLDSELIGNYGPGMISSEATYADRGKREITLMSTLAKTQVDQLHQNGFVIMAFKVGFKTANEPIGKGSFAKEDELFNHVGKHQFPDIIERKKFVEQLKPGESGEFGGWHYLKVRSSLTEQAGSNE